MAFTLKSYVPRSVYGRAALILILPVVVVQLVVSVIFIQRHFDGVTRQMSRSAAIEIGLVLSQIDTAQDLATAQARAGALGLGLKITVDLPTQLSAPPTDQRDFWDLSGREVGAILHNALPQVLAVDLSSDPRTAQVWVQTQHGAMRLAMPRVRLVDMNLLPRGTQERVLAPQLLAAIEKRIAAGEQSLLLLNRRGYAPVLHCGACAWKSGCPQPSRALFDFLTH